MRHISLIVLFMLFTACSTLDHITKSNYYPNTVESWRGGNINTLIQRWGTPDDQIVAASGNTLYIYKTASYSNSPETGAPGVGVNYSGTGKPVLTAPAPKANPFTQDTLTLSCTVVFEANNENKIISTKIDGNNCYGDRDFASRKGNPNAPIATAN